MDSSKFSFNFLEFVDGQGYALSLEEADKVLVRVDRFFPNEFFGEKVGMGWGSGHFSLHNFVLSVVVRGSVHVVWNIDGALCPVNHGVDFF